MTTSQLWRSVLVSWLTWQACALSPHAAEPDQPAIEPFQSDNLVAWCIVPFDAKKRGPKERVEMLAKLGFKKYAYDWRAEHLPTFGEELELLKQHGIELTGLWFPTAMNDEARTLLTALRDHKVKTQLWVTGGGGLTANAEEQRQRVAAEVQRIRPIAEAAREAGCQVALYNHGGWFGEPENQLEIITALNMPNVGIVYNQHHGHDHVDRFAALLKKMQPHLLALNLNGMVPKGDQIGQKIMPLGSGPLDLALLKVVKASGYHGPIGILGHTQDDAEERLSDNLDGLRWLLPQLAGKPAGPLPAYRTYKAPKPPGEARLVPGKFGKALEARNGGVHLDGQPAFREAPLTLELWAKLPDRGPYHILVANELKSSGTHWELFSMAGSGNLTVYLPGHQPDHVNSSANIGDDQWHALAMVYEPTRVRLFVDGKPVADQKIERRTDRPSQPGGLAIGELVGREIGCGGLIDDVRLSKGVREITAAPTGPLTRDEQTLQLWPFNDEKALPKVSAKPAKQPGSHWGKDAVGFDWTENDSVDGRWNSTNVGPFLAHTLFLHQLPPVRKALSMRVGDAQEATVCFDTENLQWRAAWTDGFLNFDPARYGLIAAPKLEGNLTFAVKNQPGWSIPGSAEAPRLQYRALHQHGRKLAVAYTVNDVSILERPEFARVGEVGIFRRQIEIGTTPADLKLHWGQLGTNPRLEQHDGMSLLLCDRGEQTLAAALSGPLAKWDIATDGAVNVHLADAKASRRIEVRIGIAHAPQKAALLTTLRAEWPADDHATWTKPAATLWPEEIVTQGQRGADDRAYVIDTLTLPVDNPYKALLFVGGHDFFANGDIALCTAHGDVWRVSGVDDTLSRLVWKRYATGLYQPLGLKVVDDHVYVLGRDQITRLIDQNGDDAADGYECFCNQYESSPGGHDYVTCLERDSHGNWYLAHANQGVVRISPDGRQVESIATGLRNPNGLGVGGGDIITVAPQEGEWTPASAIFEVHPGDHYGYKGPKITEKRPLGYDPPLCWLPRRVDNSCGGQCWADTKQWGPLSGLMLHFSFGQCTMLPVLREVVDGVAQGAAMEWPLSFDSGVMRGRFSPRDGQLYVSGLKGWVSSAVNDGCLQRVRYTGKPVLTPVAMKSYRNGIALTFSQPLSKEQVEDAGRYRVQRWDYRYGAEYGSEEYRDVKKGVVGREDVEVLSATVHHDRKTLFLMMDQLRPAMQYAITGEVVDAQGRAATLALYPTINKVRETDYGGPTRVHQITDGRLDPSERERIRPGLQFTVTRSLPDSSQRDVGTARLAAWQVGKNESPVQRITPGYWQAELDGLIQIPDKGTYQFRVEGERVFGFWLNHKVVAFDDQGWTAPVSLSRGHFQIRLNLTSTRDGSASGRLLWQSNLFSEEPVPPTLLWHDPRSGSDFASTKLGEMRALFENHRCGRCHAAPPNLQGYAAADLRDLGQRLRPEAVFHRLLNPHQQRADSTMPTLFADTPEGRQAAADVTAFLCGSRTSDAPAVDQAEDVAVAKFEDLGCIACHRWTAPGESDVHLRISLYFTREKYHPDALLAFLKEPSRHFPATRMPQFRLTDDEAQSLADVIRTKSTGVLNAVPELARADRAAGEKHATNLRCAACHTGLIPEDKERTAEAVAMKSFTTGCLAETRGKESSPWFALSENYRAALQKFVSLREDLRHQFYPSPAEDAERQIQRLRCTACHHRDNIISPRGEIISEESDRGLPPETLPNLTFAGEKLHEKAIADIVGGKVKEPQRTWLKARMPAFPFYAEAIAKGLAAQHGVAATQQDAPAVAVTQEVLEIGKQLTLTQGGLDCRQCHGIGGQLAAGDGQTQLARGIDFLAVKQRVRYDFYRRFVLDPPRYDIGTRMPKFVTDGRITKVNHIYDGDARQQFDAIWVYLQSLEK